METDRQLGEAAAFEADTAFILETDPAHCAANALLGGLRLSQCRYDEAEKFLRQSIATLPTAEAVNDLAETLRNKNKLNDAEKSARQALRINPSFYQAWDTLGCILSDQNRLGEADAAFRSALSICAKDPRLYISLARLKLKMKRNDEAQQILEQAAPLVSKASTQIGKDFASLTQAAKTTLH